MGAVLMRRNDQQERDAAISTSMDALTIRLIERSSLGIGDGLAFRKIQYLALFLKLYQVVNLPQHLQARLKSSIRHLSFFAIP